MWYARSVSSILKNSLRSKKTKCLFIMFFFPPISLILPMYIPIYISNLTFIIFVYILKSSSLEYIRSLITRITPYV